MTVPFMDVVLAQASKRATMPLPERWYAAPLHRNRQPYRESTRVGDWNATICEGNRFHCVCVRCGLQGEIFLADGRPEREHCPRCTKLPLELYQPMGFAGLLPPEVKPKALTVVSADNVDEQDEQLDELLGDDVTELSLDEKLVVAGEEVPEEDSEQSEEQEAVADDES